MVDSYRSIRCGRNDGRPPCESRAYAEGARPHPAGGGIKYVSFVCGDCGWTAVELVRPEPEPEQTPVAEFPSRRRGRDGEVVDLRGRQSQLPT